MSKRILLSGYYGFDNAGDEAVLYAIIESLRQVGLDDITVLSANPQHSQEQYGVKAVDRWGKKAILQAIKGCDLFISGGGSLLQDVTSKNGILYYLGLIWLAQKKKKPVMIYAQGIGPINHGRNQRLTAKLLNKARAITVRDLASRQALLDMGVTRQIQVGVDPVLGSDPGKIEAAIGEQILQASGWQPAGGPTLMVSVRPWQEQDEALREIALACDHFGRRGWQVVFLPMHYPEDNAEGQKVAEIMHLPAIVLEGNYSPSETMSLIKNSDFVLGMRLHALIMAAVFAKPMTAISYDPKVDSFMDSLRLPQRLALTEVDSARLIKLIEETWSAKEQTSAQIAQMMAIIAEQAKAPGKIVLELLQ